jgi:hypothetical protein
MAARVAAGDNSDQPWRVKSAFRRSDRLGSPGPFGPYPTGREKPKWPSISRLEHEEETPADPPTLHTAVPNWQPGDAIPLGADKSLRSSKSGTGASQRTFHCLWWLLAGAIDRRNACAGFTPHAPGVALAAICRRRSGTATGCRCRMLCCRRRPSRQGQPRYRSRRCRSPCSA